MNNEVMKSTGESLAVKDYIKNYLFNKASMLTANEEEELKNLYVKNVERIFSLDWFNPFGFYRSFITDMHPSHIIIRRENRELFSAFKEIWKETNPDTFAELRKIILTIYHKAMIYALAWQPVNTIVVSNFASVRKAYYKSLLQISPIFIPIYTQLSYVCTNIKDNKLNWNQHSLNEMDILNIIARLSLFRAIDNASRRNIVRSIPKYYDEFRKTNKELTVENFINFLNQINILPSEEKTINGLFEFYLDKHKNIAKCVLVAAELGSVDVYDEKIHKFDLSKIQLEHIFPRNDKKWEKEFRGLGRMDDFYFFQSKKNHIANLIILPSRMNAYMSRNIFKNKIKVIARNSYLGFDHSFMNFHEYNIDFLKSRMMFIVGNFAKFFNISKRDGFERKISEWGMAMNSLMLAYRFDEK